LPPPAKKTSREVSDFPNSQGSGALNKGPGPK